MDLLRILKQVSVPLPFEQKKGYTNQSVKGGYATYALEKIQQALFNENRKELRDLLNQLCLVLKKYSASPSKESWNEIQQNILSIRCIVLKPVNYQESLALLKKPLRFVKGIGPKKELVFERIGIQNLGDLLHYFPRGYSDRTALTTIADATIGERQTFKGQVISLEDSKKGRLHFLKIMIRDHTGHLMLVFFNQTFLKKIFDARIQKTIIVSGKVSCNYNRLQMDNPEFEWVDEDSSSMVHTARIVPFYKLTEGIYPKTFRSIIYQALQEYLHAIYEFIPLEILSELDFPSRGDAVYNMHFPIHPEYLEKSRSRIVFEEFLLGQFSMLRKKESMKKYSSHGYALSEKNKDSFAQLLPYQLTQSQIKVIEEIMHDLKQEIPMNRLVHGDVGSGKTTVAASALYYSFLNRQQSAYMAPTEILSRQCYENFSKLFGALDIRIELLVSDTREKDKKRILEELKSQRIDIIVGTHALIQQNVSFHSLGLVVVDEQHRFGVKQRLELRKKGTMPHLLVMSATPIPRTLALTRYGDLDISMIDQMPMGIKKIKTSILPYQKLSLLYQFVKTKINEGGKAFVVCPLVNESEKMDLSSSIAKFEELSQEFESYSVLLLHGKMNAKEKEAIMDKFASGEGQILVSTTVIEVGIDIPEANIMIVENADRFGLAQLHQLRGRIGRKSQPSYCYLMVRNRDSAHRLKILEETSSGFVVAQKDFELRGPGEIWGEQQSGYVLESMVDLEKDLILIEKAKEFAYQVSKNPKASENLIQELRFRGWPELMDDLLESG